MPEFMKFMLLGLLVGTLSGMLGIGGGVLIIPALVLWFGFTQEQAVGTSLAMLLPPIGIFAVISYWTRGDVNVRAATFLALAFAIGALGGAQMVGKGWVPATALRQGFAFFMIYLAGTMLFRSDARTWAVFRTAGLVVLSGLAFLLARMLAKRWDGFPDPAQTYRRLSARPHGADYEI